MADQIYTIIIVPHTRTTLRKFQISHRTLSYVLISLAMLLVICAGTMVHYVKLYKQARHLENIQAENARLKANLQESQLITQKLNKKIAFLNDLSNKLKVMAGLPENQRGAKRQVPNKMGMGGVTMGVGSEQPDTEKLLSLTRRADYLEKSLALLTGYFETKHQELSTTPSILPVEGFISSFFGSRQNPFTNAPDFHEGLDITNNVGTPVVAPADGVILFVGNKGQYGLVVEIQHDQEIKTLFGHLDKILVKPGQKVKRWETIGLLGNTGKSTGPHLHYEVHVSDQPVNPLPYILNLDTLAG